LLLCDIERVWFICPIYIIKSTDLGKTRLHCNENITKLKIRLRFEPDAQENNIMILLYILCIEIIIKIINVDFPLQSDIKLCQPSIL